ncbi:alpha/beta fold hydrolase [Enemella sp. A6]|uniref:alpha/beta fold hydrolase n=1 Tax=Enemella sp. A6 TaxID=3440152 RepID=UPI003EBA84F1
MERLITASNGTELCIDEFGDPEAPLVVQLEGHQAQLVSVPDSYCHRLADAGLRVIRVDNRDVGRSQRFSGVEYTLTEMAEDIHGLLQVLGRPAVVCGRSMGGAIAQLLAVHHPESVLGLGLFYTFTKHHHAGRIPPESSAPFTGPAQYRAWLQRSLPPIAGPDHPYSAEYLEWLARTQWARGVDWDGYQRQHRAMWREPAWAEALTGVRVPVAIVHGAADALTPPANAELLARLLPQAELHLVPGLGHQQPEALDDLFVAATLHAAGR